MELKIEYIPIDNITPYEKNANRHDKKSVEAIKNSITEFEMCDPIGVWGDKNIIVEGHGRLMALKELGYTEAPIIRLDHLTDEQRRAYTLAHNKTNEFSEWDINVLDKEIDDILNIDMSDFGFEGNTKQAEIIEDDIPEIDQTEPICKQGQLWQLGRHRLLCGDSVQTKNIEMVTNGETVDLVLTDPPYGINADKGFSGAGGFSGKGKPIPRRKYNDKWDNKTPPKECFDRIIAKSEKSIIFGGNYFTDKLPVGKFWLCWNKHNTMPTYSDAELAWTNIKRTSVKIYDYVYNGLIGKEKERYHPTQKPVGLMTKIIEDFTDENNIILDCFGGSGTTLIACEQTKRICYMIEYEPHYCDVIIKRWENITGQKAKLI